ncbi:MAG: histidinol dehydrogenase [Ruminococcaceae bacterium]|nr:histidinol dehydrogenase [Oscillospiraceae bacterium]
MIDMIDSSTVDIDAMLRKREDAQPDVSAAVGEILQAVKTRGDAALLDYTERFDGVRPAALRVTAQEIDTAMAQVGEAYLAILREAAENIVNFHSRQVRQGFVMAERPGIVMGQRVLPLERVGVYVPGGTAAYPSTVLMDVIPAKIAGVSQIIMVTPPEKDGSVHPNILAAAGVAGVTDIYKVGGAQAVAALSYGTQSIPRVDKIVGPGNIYVATAKRMVYGMVDIDMIAGPSDILIIADESADAAFVAADMLGQSEHDENAAAVLVTTSAVLAGEVQAELKKQLALLSRKEIAEASLQKNGRILLTSTIEKAAELSNKISPEHLEICVNEPFALLPAIRNAGSVFLGHYTPEALGDYFAGPNHTLPTAGTARFYSPLSVDDFVKKSSYLYYDKTALKQVADKVITFAESEGLTAHANSVAVRKATEEA